MGFEYEYEPTQQELEQMAADFFGNYDTGDEIFTRSEWKEILAETDDDPDDPYADYNDEIHYIMIGLIEEQGLVANDDAVKMIGAPSYSTGHVKGNGEFDGYKFSFDKNTALDKTDINWEDDSVFDKYDPCIDRESYTEYAHLNGTTYSFPHEPEHTEDENVIKRVNEFVEKQLNKQLEERKKERSQDKKKDNHIRK